MATNQINIKNRRASFDYEIIETFNAGIVLTGTEIKSIRQGKAGLTDTYCVMENGELWVKNMYIAEYSQGSYNNHVTHRDRKLLLNKKEIQKIAKAGEQPGYSIIPLRVFLNERVLEKMAIAIARGKKQYDKRQSIKEREDKRKARLSEKKALSDKKEDNSKKEKAPLNVPLRATDLKSSLDDVAVDNSTSEKVPPIEETDNIE